VAFTFHTNVLHKWSKLLFSVRIQCKTQTYSNHLKPKPYLSDNGSFHILSPEFPCGSALTSLAQSLTSKFRNIGTWLFYILLLDVVVWRTHWSKIAFCKRSLETQKDAETDNRDISALPNTFTVLQPGLQIDNLHPIQRIVHALNLQSQVAVSTQYLKQISKPYK